MAEGKSGSRKKQDVNLDIIGLEMGNKPPQALDVEEAVLGAMMLEGSCVDLVMEELNSACFYDPKHRMVFEAIVSLTAEHTPVDIVTVTSMLRQKGNLETVGGVVALASMTEKVAAASNIEVYAKLLKEKTIQRDLIKASFDILKDAFDESVKVDDLIDKAQSRVYDAIQSNVRKEVQDIGSIINAAMQDIQEHQDKTGLTGVPSGFVSLDKITMGWQPSDLIILAARPSVGKTAFALNLARNAAVDHHKPVAVFSLEMSAVQLVKRIMTSESGLSADKIKGGSRLEDYEWEQLEYKIKNLSKAPLYIDDTPGLPVMEFRTKAKSLVKNKGVKLIIVDYLQLMQAPGDYKGMREQEVAFISRTLKATAKELNVPIIALSQLSRASVQRSGATGKPQLSDLRESGSIEQDADMVLFIHRPDYVGMSDSEEDKEKTQIIIAKHRNGETCDIDMRFRGEQVRFVEIDDLRANELQGPIASAMNDDTSVSDSPAYDAYQFPDSDFN
ncbi:MAG: replicative DNA helicase [Candidatus Cryptobacteroides sp.]|nr:replicative DNA helicase [Candidatus Cryptobacteroides sp.]